MDKPKKSVTFALAVLNSWTWKGSRQLQVMQGPAGPGQVGQIRNYTLAWGCFAGTVTVARIQPAPQLVVAPASGLVDLRGQALQQGGR